MDDFHGYSNHLASLEGRAVYVAVSRLQTPRSMKANRYYWGVVVKTLADFCGYDPDDMHEALAMKFLRIDDCPITGVPRRKHTPDTDTAEFARYVDDCIRLAAELGVVIPDPQHAEAVAS